MRKESGSDPMSDALFAVSRLSFRNGEKRTGNAYKQARKSSAGRLESVCLFSAIKFPNANRGVRRCPKCLLLSGRTHAPAIRVPERNEGALLSGRGRSLDNFPHQVFQRGHWRTRRKFPEGVKSLERSLFGQSFHPVRTAHRRSYGLADRRIGNF